MKRCTTVKTTINGEEETQLNVKWLGQVNLGLQGEHLVITDRVAFGHFCDYLRFLEDKVYQQFSETIEVEEYKEVPNEEFVKWCENYGRAEVKEEVQLFSSAPQTKNTSKKKLKNSKKKKK